jgi:UDP-GlcNAc:undecaprenyl-phosphate/decaprenyl-phosphate GlcNAc-1-phosphate transferase
MIPYTSTTSFWFEAILFSSVLVILIAIISIQVAKRFSLLDLPYSAPHKLHEIPTPIAGGIALVATLLIASIFLGNYRDPLIQASFAAAAIVFLFGLWDDFKGISPLVKLAGQVLAAVVLIRLGISIQIFHSPEFFFSGSGPLFVVLNLLATIVWVVGITNALNFVDSMDGLALGLGGMATAFFMLVTYDAGQTYLSQFSAFILGACIGLYFLNSSPAHLFLGDSGSQVLGILLAALGIAYHPQDANQASSWFVPVMLLAIPIFDTTLVVISRLRRGKRVYSAARDHTYHRLLAFGVSSSRAVLMMQVSALLIGCLAFVVLPRPPIFANMVFAIVVLLGLFLLVYFDARKRWF